MRLCSRNMALMLTQGQGWTDMTKVKQQIRARNWVAKNNFNRPVRHRDRTEYQRQPKHRSKEAS